MINIGDEEEVNLECLSYGMSEQNRSDRKKQKAQEKAQRKNKKSADSGNDKNKKKKDKSEKKKNTEKQAEKSKKTDGKKAAKGDKNKKERLKKNGKKKMKRGIKALIIVGSIIAVLAAMYLTVVFGNIPFVVKWRNIWIETAMTTDQHQWLAKAFFPSSIIDEVMSAQVDVKDIGMVKNFFGGTEGDILGQKNLTAGEKDAHGNKVLVNDIEQGIVILQIKTSNFVGRLTLIDDPSRVFIGTTDQKGTRGKFICDYLLDENAILGTNASGFSDPDGVGVGGIVTGKTIASGEGWGKYSSKYITVGFDTHNRLIVGEISDWDAYKLRDAFQYHPALIINGDKVIEGSSGWGLQPRTVIGQCENGVVMILVVDGRQVGYSIGATMGDCADILEKYGAVNAGACDGGSSSVLAYNGEILNKPSTNMPTGRYLPNAWLVKRK